MNIIPFMHDLTKRAAVLRTLGRDDNWEREAVSKPNVRVCNEHVKLCERQRTGKGGHPHRITEFELHPTLEDPLRLSPRDGAAARGREG